MENSQNKLNRIKEFIDNWIRNTKERGKMYGSLSEIEAQWWVLDRIYLILEDVPETENFWGDFLCEKGFGAKNASIVVKELKTESPYSELNKLRNEFEEWRAKKIKKIKKLNNT